MAAPTKRQFEKNWFAEILAFRSNPQRYLASKKMEDDSLVFDILQALYSDSLQAEDKIHLLGVLQEYAGLLLLTADSTEQTVASLQSVYTQAYTSNNAFYSSQILVTITSVLVQFDTLEENGELFQDFMHLLLDTVCQVNRGQLLVRSTACQCLQELEIVYPGLLLNKLEYLYQMSQMENSYINQSYVMLFVSTLNGVLTWLTEKDSSIGSRNLNDLLCTRIEPLKEFTLPYEVRKYKPQSAYDLDMNTNVATKELYRAMTFMLDNSSYLNIACRSRVFSEVADIIAKAKLSSNLLSSVFERYSSTTDLAIFQVLQQIKTKFRNDPTFEEVDDEWLAVRHLVSCTSHPNIGTVKKLIILDWLTHFVIEKEEKSSSLSSNKLLTAEDHKSLFPSIFDNIDVHLRKIRILSLHFTPTEEEADLSLSHLLGAISCLYKLVNYGVEGRAAAALFKAFFIYYKAHHNTVLAKHVAQFLEGIVTVHASLMPYMLDFLQAVQDHHPDSSLPLAVLSQLCRHLVSTDLHLVMSYLPLHLTMLETAACCPNIKPKNMIDFLQELLLSTDICDKGDWLLGSSLLRICHSLMHHQTTNNIFIGLAEVLHIIFSKYEDIDISDRAKFYYSMLTNISDNKLSSILGATITESKDRSQSIVNFVESSSNFPGAGAVINLHEECLRMTRIKCEPQCLKQKDDFSSGTPNEIKTYMEKICSSAYKSIRMTFYIHFAKKVTSFDEIYSLVLHIEDNPNYGEIKDVCIPCLRRSESSEPGSECSEVSVEFSPKYPVPADFAVRAVFTDEGGHTYACHLPNLTVTFEDLFCPLPVSWPQEDICNLFSMMWKEFTATENIVDCATSVHCLKQDKTTQSSGLIETLQDYHLVSKNDHEDEEDKLAVFLPPNTHLLMKVRKEFNDLVVISIATDNWKILPLVSTFLNKFNSSENSIA